jgi:hypothetical protein
VLPLVGMAEEGRGRGGISGAKLVP